MQSASSCLGLLTRGLTGKLSSHAAGQGTSRLRGSVAAGSSQPAWSSGARITGIRSWIGATSSLAGQVTIVQERTTVRRADPSSAPTGRRRRTGPGPCGGSAAVGAPCPPCATRRSRRPAPGSGGGGKPRETAAACARSRARALIRRLPILRSSAQNGTRPQRTMISSRPIAIARQAHDRHVLGRRDVVARHQVRPLLEQEQLAQRIDRRGQEVTAAHDDSLRRPASRCTATP